MGERGNGTGHGGVEDGYRCGATQGAGRTASRRLRNSGSFPVVGRMRAGAAQAVPSYKIFLGDYYFRSTL